MDPTKDKAASTTNSAAASPAKPAEKKDVKQEDVTKRRFTVKGSDQLPVPTGNAAVAVVDGVGYTDDARVAHNLHCRNFAVTWTDNGDKFDGTKRAPAAK